MGRTGGGVVLIVAGLVIIGLGISDLPLAELIGQSLFAAFVGGAVSAGLGAGTVSLARRAPAELEEGAALHESKLLGDSGES